jgi:hypothetical protein
MGGGLLQLVAYGAQDVYLTGNPQITFFKVVYRRHTNFAIEAIEQSFNGNNNFGSRVSIQITRNGDLIHRVYFYATIKNNTALHAAPGENGIALVPYFGQRLLKTIELEIGGQRIDKHYSEWLYIWNELTMCMGKKEGYQLMVGGDKYNRAVYLAAQSSYEIYVPLEFWFCRNVGLALPLIALQYHEVKINIEYATVSEMYDASNTNYCNKSFELVDDADGTTAVTAVKNSALGGTSSASTYLLLENVSMWVDYIFLDTDERRRFAQLSHEYLIEQLQFTGTDTITATSDPSSMKSVRMNFNHPVKELIFAIRSSSGSSHAFWNNFTDRFTDNEYIIAQNPVLRAKIQLNGNDRMAERDGNYYSIVQPYQHHEITPNTFHQGINVYSFAIKPEEHQPSGSLNMSRIDTAILSVASSIAGSVYVFAVNYNVLRILSGMGGLAYSN